MQKNTNLNCDTWSHLPNAKHIDAVIASLKAHPQEWIDAWNICKEDSVWAVMLDAACCEAWDVCKKDLSRSGVWDATLTAAQYAAQDAVLALMAYDDCAHLLYSDPREVELLAKFNVTAAVLIWPTSMVMSKNLREIHL